MSEKDKKIPLESIMPLPDGKGINRTYIDIIMQEEIPVLCINKDNKKKRLMPFKVLFDNNGNFWQQSGVWKYFLSSEDYEKLKEKSIVKAGDWELERPKKASNTLKKTNAEELEELKAEAAAGYGSEIQKFADMSVEDKVNHLKLNKSNLDMLNSKTNDNKVITEALVDSTKDAALINHLVFKEALQVVDEEAKKLTKDIVDTTHEMVKSSVQLISSEKFFNDDLMNTLVSKSNGTIVQHMTRVFLNGIAFLSYFNKLVSTSSTIQKLRISFVEKYRKFYHALLPGFAADNIILERVFIMDVPTPSRFYILGVGVKE